MKLLPSMRPSRWLLVGVIVLPLAVAGAVFAEDHKGAQSRPIPLGVSGGNINDIEKAFCYTGTLGALVEKSGGQYVLSNNHVLARSNKATIGDDIVQPGLADSSCQKTPKNAVADLSQFVPIQFAKGRVATTNKVDAAIAKTKVGQVKSDGTILEIGTISNQTTSAAVDCAVKKSGRTTGLTTGSVSATDVTVTVDYGSGNKATFTGQFLVTPGTFSAGGDSGSLIVTNEATPQAVGLLFAGSSSYTIANPISEVLSAFGVTMVGTSGGEGCSAATSAVASAGAAKGRHQNEIMDLPGVVGVGVGAAGQVEVYVENENARGRIPAHVDGVPVRIVVTGSFVAR